MKPAVIYTHDLEPITVVTLQMWLWDRLEKGDGEFTPYSEERPNARLSGAGTASA